MRNNREGCNWPKIYDAITRTNIDAPTHKDPITGIEMCKDCWSGIHKRSKMCIDSGCKCNHYQGRNQGLVKPKPPRKSERPMLPDVGGFDL